jgi:hypothetical protein
LPAYEPAPLSAVPDGRFNQLVQAARQRRLVLYLGAGLSMAPPSCGPAGPAVSDVLRPLVARTLDVEASTLDGLSLEELAQRVVDEHAERLEELKDRASVAFDFKGIPPNYGHAAAALLLREGLTQIISVNWDCGVERAGIQAGIGIQGVANATESIQLAHSLPLYKVHGCATRPPTLAITQAEVDRPQTWAVGRTQGAMANGVVVFVGLGTVGLYVKEPIPELVDAWASQDGSVVVVDPQLQDSWREALGEERAQAAHIASKGNEFFDELLRAVVRDALDITEMDARDLATHEEWAAPMVHGLGTVRDALDIAHADGVLRWWRDGVAETEAGKPFITEMRGRKCLMTVARLVGMDGGPVEIAGARGRQTVASERRYFEIACRPGKHVSRVEAIVRDRIETRRADGVYPKGKPVTVVVIDETGTFPAESAPVDIAAGEADGADIADGVEAAPITFVSADDGVRRERLAA